MLLLDPEDRFKASCAVYSDYPTNVISTQYHKRKLSSYKATLEAERDGLFDGTRGTLRIVEFNNGRRLPDFETSQQAELETHLQRGMEDPHLRYIAIEAPDSRSSLSCSHAMFTYLSSYHQISPSFIPAVTSFGKNLNLKNVCLAFFESDDSLLVPYADQKPLRSLGRSGSAIQLSYLLRVVERSSSIYPWSFIVQPLAVYHSYDVHTGRTLWVTVKGNSTTRKQVCESLDDSLHPESVGRGQSFIATLDLHLSLLETVDEHWQLYINEIDRAVRNTTSKASNARIDTGPHFRNMQQDIKQQFLRSGIDHMDQNSQRDSLSHSVKSLVSIKFGSQSTSDKGALGDARPAPTEPKKNNTWRKWSVDNSGHTTPGNQEDEYQNIMDKYLKLDMFSFEDNQNLHRYGETIQEAILTIKLDVNVIQGLREFYQCETTLNSVLKEKNDKTFELCHVKAFVARLKSIENSLRIKQQQLESLELSVREAKLLYDGVSQYLSVQISKIYAQSAHASAQRMERIAGTTEKETARSMHVMTFLTLIFLPGTFIASFLQSGVFQWKDEDTKEQPWLFRLPVFKMFIEICLVMMLITFLVWLLIFRWLQGRSRGPRDAVREDDASDVV